jgi:hypothetical protein
MRQVFLERADLDGPAFKAWFKNSQVVGEDGKPAVVYHGTTALGDFDKFTQSNDVGHHFGTAQAANDRLDFMAKDARKQGNPRTVPVYLSIQNALDMDDEHTWEPSGILDALEHEGLVSADDPRYSKDMLAIRTTSDKQRANDALRRLIKNTGHDGIRYTNSSEDAGSTSWVALDPGQIKSVFNRGTFDRRRASIME